MQWSAEPHGGFTKSDQPILPVISGGAFGFEHVNVAAQRRDPDSLMNWMERMIRIRKETPEIGWGEFSVLQTGTPEVLAMRYDWRNNSVVVVHNFSAISREVGLEVGVENSELLVNLLSHENSHSDASGKHCVLLEPYGYRWFRVGGLDYILKRSEAKPDPK
jgi:maltose alpha-D-glucosyltransferase/alpha-amylase